MPPTSSFDITSPVDFQEVDNALNQARKEVGQRYDFKGAKADIVLDAHEKTLTLVADDEFKMSALWEIVQTRLVRRSVPLKNFKVGESEAASGGAVRKVISIQEGIPIEAARDIVKFIKDESGGEVLEYALIAGLIVVLSIAMIGAVGTKVLGRWTSLNNSL